LAHEMVHEWLSVQGIPTRRNYHSKAFHEAMAMIGIETMGATGNHVGYTFVGDTDESMLMWQWWIGECADLGIDRFILPGAKAKQRRKLIKYECELCKATFRSRKRINATCNPCNAPFLVATTRAEAKEEDDDNDDA
jgi:hypothetical protein